MEKPDRRIQSNERLVSLDAFRGMTMLFLISHSFGLNSLAGAKGIDSLPMDPRQLLAALSVTELPDDFTQLIEHINLIFGEIHTIKDPSQMPISGMDKSHDG